jgi:hypothetical protein
LLFRIIIVVLVYVRFYCLLAMERGLTKGRLFRGVLVVALPAYFFK